MGGGSQGRTHPEHEASITRGCVSQSILICAESPGAPVSPWPQIQRAACGAAVDGAGDVAARARIRHFVQPSREVRDVGDRLTALPLGWAGSVRRVRPIPPRLWSWLAEVPVTGLPPSWRNAFDQRLCARNRLSDRSISICVAGERISDRRFGRTRRLQEVVSR
jgi:hypothetical protein